MASKRCQESNFLSEKVLDKNLEQVNTHKGPVVLLSCFALAWRTFLHETFCSKETTGPLCVKELIMVIQVEKMG